MSSPNERVVQLTMMGDSRFPDPFPPPFASAWGDDEFGLWIDIILPPSEFGASVSQRLRWIEPGTFLMGSPDDEAERFYNEGPRHPVTITKGFWLAETVCTQEFWQTLLGNNPSRFTHDPQNPVEQVNWNEVQAFLRQLESRLQGCHVGLPTEAEWEYACRAGTDTPFSLGKQITPEQVNYNGDFPYAGSQKGLNREQTVPVKSFQANHWGLYEMHGNVWEWCADGQRNYDAEAKQDPVGPVDEGEKARRVVRGGSWIRYAGWTRSAKRETYHLNATRHYLGFRICLRSILSRKRVDFKPYYESHSSSDA